jgi:hypothetical protein
MKISTVLLLGVGALAVWEFQQIGTAAATVQFVFSGVQIKSLTNYVLQITVQNISNADCVLNAMSGTITVNDNDLGNVSDFSPVNIRARSQQVVNITLQPSILSLPGAITDIINNSGGQLDFVFEGNANVNGLVLPINVEKIITV